MTFYAAFWVEAEPAAPNCEWFTDKADAERSAADKGGGVEVLEVEPTREGLLALLRNKVWRV